MSILLDTHVFLWAAEQDSRLRPSAQAMLSDPEQAVYLSAVSALEIAIKWGRGRLALPNPPVRFVSDILAAAEISQLAITVRDACAVGDLPPHHNDPFDRLLVAQARTNGLRLMTADPILEKYDVDLIPLWRDSTDE